MAAIDLRQLQGNILRSYGQPYGFVRHLILSVLDPDRARAALGSMVDGGHSTPAVTRADADPKTPTASCVNVGITYRGLEALGLPKASLATFPREFREGMVARADMLGDLGASAPRRWIPGLADTDRLHVLVTIHAQDKNELDAVAHRVVDAEGCRAFTPVTVAPLDGAALTDPFVPNRVHFGFRDGISGPRFEEARRPEETAQRHYAPLGIALLGHEVPYLGMTWRVPQPDVLGYNGTFGAFRMLRQDVAGFEAFLRDTAAANRVSAEEVAAKMCGRWRNGAPLVQAATKAKADAMDEATIRNNDFLFREDDPNGSLCPIGSHIRRTNPRDALIVQRGTNANRTVLRRGMPYGPIYDPTQTGEPGDPTIARGLLGNFLCASLSAQFESLQRDWVNLGLIDPRITGTNDPMVGANDGTISELRWTPNPGEDGTRRDEVVTRGVPSFVETQGGAYHFLPSIPSLRWIAAGGWRQTGR